MHRYSSDHYYISRPQVWIHCSQRISGQTSFCNLRRNTDDPPSATPGNLYGEGGDGGDDGGDEYGNDGDGDGEGGDSGDGAGGVVVMVEMMGEFSSL